MITKDIVDKYATVRAAAEEADRIVAMVVNKYAEELDEFMHLAEEYLNEIRDGKRPAFDDDALGRMVLRLPVITYNLCDGLDRSAIESDVAKAAVENVRAQHYMDAPEGTIPEKKAYADLATAGDAQVVDLTKHVHSRLKAKIESANGMFDGIRKVMSARDIDKTVFGREMRR